jgi:hypothetical protein
VGITDAKKYIGKKCAVRFLDRTGTEHNMTSIIHDVTFVPLYGGYLITDTEDLRLDKVVGVQLCDEMAQMPLAA